MSIAGAQGCGGGLLQACRDRGGGGRGVAWHYTASQDEHSAYVLALTDVQRSSSTQMYLGTPCAPVKLME